MSLPIGLITGQLLTDAVWQPLLEAWPDREVVVADNRSDDTIEGFAKRLLDNSPPRFALVAHAMGGFGAVAGWDRRGPPCQGGRKIGRRWALLNPLLLARPPSWAQG